MPLTGEEAPGVWDWVNDQVAAYEASGGAEANTLMDTGIPIILVATRGAKSGKIRKFALMRVEHDGEYALVASTTPTTRPTPTGRSRCSSPAPPDRPAPSRHGQHDVVIPASR
ncbi:MAG TPA: nitroreductase/quinone reductase family protein [Ilumatobacteraceae bacterium]|nr:nitroreductase/quinone reductase family protein [Ilumatobacteraceae bacterium]